MTIFCGSVYGDSSFAYVCFYRRRVRRATCVHEVVLVSVVVVVVLLFTTFSCLKVLYVLFPEATKNNRFPFHCGHGILRCCRLYSEKGLIVPFRGMVYAIHIGAY
jgi:hypothetical protein